MVCRSTPRSRGSYICHYVVSHLFGLLLLLMMSFSPPLFTVYSFSVMGFLHFPSFLPFSLLHLFFCPTTHFFVYFNQCKRCYMQQRYSQWLHTTLSWWYGEYNTSCSYIVRFEKSTLNAVHTRDIIFKFSHMCHWFINASSPFATLLPSLSSAFF